MAMKIGASSDGGAAHRIAMGIELAMAISKMVPAHLLEGSVDPGSFDGDDPADLIIELRIRSAQIESILEFKSSLLIKDLPDKEIEVESEYSREYLRLVEKPGETHSTAMRRAKLSTARMRKELFQLRALRDWLDEKQEAIHMQVVSLRKRLGFIESTMPISGNSR
jgi:hypothetical protein